MDKQVTFIICCYNNSQWIQNAIQSAKNQTVKNKICIIDDGSTDNSVEIILNTLNLPSKIEENEYIKYTDGTDLLISLSKNHGPSYARNIGIAATIKNTDVYAILDADDENYPNKLERCLKDLEDPNVGVVYADYDILDVDKDLIRREYKERFSRSRLTQECIVHSGSLISKNFLNRVKEDTGWYDSTLRCAEDLDLWLRLSEICYISHVPESLSLVRVHQNNSTNSVKKEIWNQCWQRVSQKLYDRTNKTKK